MATTAADQVRGARRRPGPRATGATRSEARLALYLLAPAAVLLLAVVGYPMMYAIYLSLFKDRRFEAAPFTGLGNYATALTNGRFWGDLGVTTFFGVTTVVLEVLIGLGMALIMHRAFRGRGVVRTAVLVPWAIPTAITSLLWLWMYQPRGVVNTIVQSKIIWTGSVWPARFAVIVADVWKTAPFVALLLLAGLQIIPNELYEAAKVDGATAWQRFRRVTLPLLKGALLVAVLFRMLDALRMFDLPYLLTRGANGTETLSILAYQESIAQLHSHYGATLSTLTFVYIMICAFLVIRAFGLKVVESAGAGGGAS
ncbi:MAG TPA: sugar ABC transporter permease [Actinomycetes bacterium]|nr:sugar ABC transporter permease [Actinomycetes bacterium]